MAEKCMCEPEEVLIFPCSGGSNVGQIANQAAVELTEEKAGKMFCLAGIGGHILGMVESAKVGKRIVGIDGCPVACGKKTLEHAGFKLTDYVVVTELGIEKKHDFKLSSKNVNKVKAQVKKSLGKV